VIISGKKGLRYDAERERVYINPTQYFAPVPPEVWAYPIGGYQVCHKWLKDRKDRTLTLDDIRPANTNKDIWDTEFERRIREVASMAVALLRRGDGVKLTTTAGRTSSATPAIGADPILRFLALIEAVDQDEAVQPRNSGAAERPRAVPESALRVLKEA